MVLKVDILEDLLNLPLTETKGGGSDRGRDGGLRKARDQEREESAMLWIGIKSHMEYHILTNLLSSWVSAHKARNRNKEPIYNRT